MMEQQQQMQAHMERERRSSNSGTLDSTTDYSIHIVAIVTYAFGLLQVLLSKDTPLCSLWPLQSYLLPWTWVVLLPLHLRRDLLHLRRGHPSLLSHLRFPWVEGAMGTSPPPRRAWLQWSPEPNCAVFRGWDTRFIYLFKEELNSLIIPEQRVISSTFQPDDNSSSSKNEVNRTSGGSGGLMEEMNALLARRS